MILENSKFICPICKNKMFVVPNGVKCIMGHSFDKAKEGYINLLIKNSARRHGDDKLMVKSRTNFLEKGYYSKLRDAIKSVVGKNHRVLDMGCGEGYYTSAFEENNLVLGIDISKEAVKAASKRCKMSDFAVASVGKIPLSDGYVDTVVTIFSPENSEEFKRILSEKGRFITVCPMENHLAQLKSTVYDTPYLNPPLKTEKEGFKLISQKAVKYDITLNCNEDIVSLFKMTPYYYKTSKTDQQKLYNLEFLKTRLEFFIGEYEKAD